MSFLSKLTKIVNTGQSRSVILTGNIYDLFFDGRKYVPLLDFLKTKLACKPVPKEQKGITQILYQVNRPIEISDRDQLAEISTAWQKFHKGKTLSSRLAESNESSVYAMEILRQLAECNRLHRHTSNNLLVMIEAADMLLPEAEISRMMEHDRKRVSIVHDWLSDPKFMDGHDTVIMLSESRSSIHHRISKLPSVLAVEIPLPDIKQRHDFIVHMAVEDERATPSFMQGPSSTCGNYRFDTVAEQTAGLSLHAIRQLLLSGDLSVDNISSKVEEYMVSQLGEGVIEFKRPSHQLDSVVGFSRVKKFLRDELIPGFRADGADAISGAAVAGPIGGGKTFICEAVASELGIPVIVLKNIRSKWYGETDQIFERLKRLLESFWKIVIFVDEADTMFGDIQSDQDTERRLTGKIQSMMSDPALRGKVIWFLMTARIHRLSPDIRRPGRMDLIIPILDPDGDDRKEFIDWTFGDLTVGEPHSDDAIKTATEHYSSAAFAALRQRIRRSGCKTIQEAIDIASDLISPDIEETREYQTLQAKLNCTRKSLLGCESANPEEMQRLRTMWKDRIVELESKGIR